MSYSILKILQILSIPILRFPQILQTLDILGLPKLKRSLSLQGPKHPKVL